MALKADLHVHTVHSMDSTITLSMLLTKLKQIGLDVVAITDHNTTAALRKAMNMASHLDIIIIPGVEISTPQGDLIVLGFNDDLPTRGNAAEIVDEVSDKGYVTIAPHPFDDRRNSLGDLCFSLNKLTALEILNARTASKFNKRAREAATILAKTGVAGSDAHEIEQVGAVYNEICAEKDLESILESIKKGKIIIKRLNVHSTML